MRFITLILSLCTSLLVPGLLHAQSDGEPADSARSWVERTEPMTLAMPYASLASRSPPPVPGATAVSLYPGVTGAIVGGAGVGGFYAWGLGASGSDVPKMLLAGAVVGAAAGYLVDVSVHFLTGKHREPR